MRSIWLLPLFLVIAVFAMSFSFFKRDYGDIAGDIRNTVGKNLAKKHRMDFIGTSAGMFDCVRMVGFSFEISRETSLDEAQYLIVDSVETLLKAFNENEKIRPYLVKYPLTTENVDISIYLNNPRWKGVDYPNSSVVSVHSDDYVTFTIMDDTPKTIKRTKEPYQEIVAIVKNGGHSLSASEVSQPAK